MITKNIYLDAWNPAETSVTVQQGEVNARFLHVHLMNNGTPLNLEGCEATVYCTKPDGTTIFNTCDITDAAKGQVTIPLTQQMGLVAGILRDMELRITDADSVLKVRGLQVRIRASGDYDASVESTDEFTALQAALNASGCYLPEVRQPADGVMEVAFAPSRPEMAPVPVQTVYLPAGPTGPVGPQGPKGDAYTLTDADRAEIAEQVEGAVLVQAPKYVDSVDKMTDTDKLYVLAETGELWAYMDTTTEQEVTIREDITGTTDNPYEVGRLSSSGTLGEAVTGYVITPYIDLTKAEYAGKTIELHLDGNRYVSETAETYIQMAIFKTDKTVLYGRASTCLDKNAAILPVLTNVTTTIHGETSATLTITIPAQYNGTDIGYMRFGGKGTESASDVYITYPGVQTVTGGQWVSTGTTYAPMLSEEDKQAMAEDVAARIDAQLLTVIGEGTVTV